MLPDNDPGADRDHQDSQGHNLSGDRLPSWRTQYQHPRIRSLIAKHCEQLSSGLVDIFRTDVEKEVKQRVSEVIVSEATGFCEQLKSKDDALLAVETRCKDLQEQLELSDKACRQLQGRVKQLEVIEAELKQRLEAALSPLESRHIAVVYERRENEMLCRLCVDGHSKDETLPVVSFAEDVKLSTLAWHIQHQHPREYQLLLNMEEGDLREVAKEMSQVGN